MTEEFKPQRNKDGFYPTNAIRPPTNDDDRVYPCMNCGVLRSKNEGGITFTVCDTCWNKRK